MGILSTAIPKFFSAFIIFSGRPGITMMDIFWRPWELLHFVKLQSCGHLRQMLFLEVHSKSHGNHIKHCPARPIIIPGSNRHIRCEFQVPNTLLLRKFETLCIGEGLFSRPFQM
jgi:hypothetical protein